MTLIYFMCVCYRLSFPPDLNSFAEKKLANSTKQYLRSYLSSSTNGSYVIPIMKTSSLTELIEFYRNYPQIIISGPKGCGKTVLCAALYEMLDANNFDCLFLTCSSCKPGDPNCTEYLQAFIEQQNDCFNKKEKSIISDKITNPIDKEEYQNTLRSLVRTVTKKKMICLFLDLSLFSDKIQSDRNSYVECLLNIAIDHYSDSADNRLVISASSGANHPFGATDGDIFTKWRNIIDFCIKYRTTGFTSTEARSYFEANVQGKYYNFDNIYPVTGCNPQLLKASLKESSVGNVKANVETIVRDYMIRNLKLVQEPKKLLPYLLNNSIIKCTKYAYCACRHGQLGDDEDDYLTTWLATNHVTVMEEVDVPILTVLSDQDDKTAPTNEDISVGKAKILRWNYPTFGDEFLNILDNFIQHTDQQELEKVCQKELTFAGFWFERKFFSYHNRNEVLHVSFISDKEDSVKNVTFNNISVQRLDKGPLKENVLYELQRAHPIVDCVGYLKDDGNADWLVFVQISLQLYKDHPTKLSKMFKCNSGNPKNKSWSLYTHYRQAYKIDYRDSSMRTLLLYVSPSESEITALMKDSIKEVHINQILNIGVYRMGSPYHEEMQRFEKMRK